MNTHPFSPSRMDNKIAEDQARLYFYIRISHFLFSSTDNEAALCVGDTAAPDSSDSFLDPGPTNSLRWCHGTEQFTGY